jgi:hypothetical protein
MRRILRVCMFGACAGGMLAAQSAAAAAIVNGVANITTSSGNNNANPGGTVLTNTGTILDGLYGTENHGYLVDDFPGAIGYDGLSIKATAVVNDEGTTSGADNSAILGYSNPVTGNRGETNLGVMIMGPNDGRLFLMVGGGIHTNLGDWANTFGRNNPFDIDLSASLSGNQLTVTGSFKDSDAPAVAIPVNVVATVDPLAASSAFGTSQGYEQIGVFRNYGVDFSNVSYVSSVPEPSTLGLLLLSAMGLLHLRRR